MKIPKVVVKTEKIEDLTDELVVSLVFRAEDGSLSADECLQDFISALASYPEFTAERDETLLIYPATGDNTFSLQAKRLLLLGMGELAELSPDDYQFYEQLRVAGGHIAKKSIDCKVKKVSILLPRERNISVQTAAQYLTEGLLLGLYAFNKYKKKKEGTTSLYQGMSKISLFTTDQLKKARDGVTLAVNTAIAVYTARDMANEPGNGWTPEHFAQYAKKAARNLGLDCTVLKKPDMIKRGMGGILAVNQGSKEQPRLVILEYVPQEYRDTILLVGKGLTFDSGGISIKPAKGMMDMKYDMCGGAAVLSTMEAVGRERPPVRVVAVVPATDNMSGGGALKPGDVIEHYGGSTSEIENTDAEGRLILADALAYGIEKYEPTCVIDLATLTGAVIIALGHHHSGLMSNNDLLVEKLLTAGMVAAEPLWRLPLGKPYQKQLKSEVADLKNTGGRPAGSITAAEYLHHFVGEVPWAHLDIAGTAWDFTEKSYIPKGPSGIGVRTLVEMIRRWQNGMAAS